MSIAEQVSAIDKPEPAGLQLQRMDCFSPSLVTHRAKVRQLLCTRASLGCETRGPALGLAVVITVCLLLCIGVGVFVGGRMHPSRDLRRLQCFFQLLQIQLERRS